MDLNRKCLEIIEALLFIVCHFDKGDSSDSAQVKQIL
jgi:hypothetical protein